MKKFMIILLSTMLVTLLAVPVFANEEEVKQDVSKVSMSSTELLVNGRGVIETKPDICKVNFQVSFKEDKQIDALSKTTKGIQALKDALLAWGIEEKDIYSDYVSVYPQYNYSEKGQGEINGYLATHSVTVTIRDMDKIGEVLDVGIQTGATNTDGLRYELSDATAVYNQALGKAAVDAKQKAAVLANNLGMTVESMVKIEETSNNRYVESGYYSALTAKEESRADGEMRTEVMVQDIKVEAQVTITYKLK